ncbi:hypothetical protein BH10PSE18_BH10PSE18_11580 [soil metagenome]
MTYEALIRIQLQPGQAWRVAADARTSLQVLDGRVVLREVSAWLPPGLWTADIPLAEGQAHRIERAGWIDVVALERSEVLSYREPGWIARALRSLKALKAGIGSFPDRSASQRPTAVLDGGVHTGPCSWILSRALLSCWPFAGSRH